MACLWSSEVLHAIRLRRATFEALCPDPVESLAKRGWRASRPGVGVTSALAILDPAAPPGTRRRTIVGIAEVDRAVPRYRGYADAAEALRRAPDAQRGRVTKTPQPR